MKLEKIVEIFPSLKFLNQLEALPVTPGFHIKNLMYSATPFLSSYDIQRIKLLEQYGIKNETTNAYDFKDAESRDAFNAHLIELLNAECDITITPIRIADFKNITIPWMPDPADPVNLLPSVMPGISDQPGYVAPVGRKVSPLDALIGVVVVA